MKHVNNTNFDESCLVAHNDESGSAPCVRCHRCYEWIRPHKWETDECRGYPETGIKRVELPENPKKLDGTWTLTIVTPDGRLNHE